MSHHDRPFGHASYVVVSLDTGKPVLETWNPAVAKAVNLSRYRVVPILEWLASLSRTPETFAAAPVRMQDVDAATLAAEA